MAHDLRLVDGPAEPTVPITPLAAAELAPWLARHPERGAWVGTVGFTAQAGTSCLVPAVDGRLERVLLGIGADERWDWAGLPADLPPGLYRIEANLRRSQAENAVFGWAMGTYRFDRYRRRPEADARLIWPQSVRRAVVERVVEATFLVRDLINTPASDMGPEELADAVRGLSRRGGGSCRVITANALLRENYPAIHAVGRASSSPPRLADLSWGDADAPKVTLVGKGVCFDTGGLDLKPSAAMKLMKKDMGGAALVIGLAQMIISAGLPVRLRLLVPAVENSVSGSSMRPLDVVQTRKGLTVEIGNTDAEGRVILADALAEAAAEDPSLLVDCATLTGAARAALGTELPALFTDDDGLADALLGEAGAAGDPLWRLPLWRPYRRLLDGKVADLTNAPDSPYAGAILAALFLAEFAAPVRAWAHIDTMAWNTESRPGRPEGGEAMGLRALYGLIERRFGGG